MTDDELTRSQADTLRWTRAAFNDGTTHDERVLMYWALAIAWQWPIECPFIVDGKLYSMIGAKPL